MTAISICILDDHPLIAAGVQHVLADTPDITCIGAATTPAALNSLLSEQTADVALVDLRLGSASGIDVCAALKQRYPEMRVLILSSLNDQAVVRRAFSAGASGFAIKSINMDMLPAAIRQVYDGGIFLSSELVATTLPASPDRPSGDAFTERERDIVQLVANGKGNKEIARELGISSHTVKMHVARLLKRFEFKSRSQLATLVGSI